MKYPKIMSVKILAGKKLEITFDNNMIKIYDCLPLLEEEPFLRLKDDTLFKNVKVDHFGYGVIWNDEIDLSESELWLNGTSIV